VFNTEHLFSWSIRIFLEAKGVVTARIACIMSLRPFCLEGSFQASTSLKLLDNHDYLKTDAKAQRENQPDPACIALETSCGRASSVARLPACLEGGAPEDTSRLDWATHLRLDAG
jgi:hypothetical protein